MFFLIIFFFSILIKSVHSICNSTEFYPCACCDPVYYHCIHNGANRFSSCFVSRLFNSQCKLDTSTYCCVLKDVVRNEIKKDNITLFKKYCQKNSNRFPSIVNTILSSCDSLSKQCYDLQNPVIPPLLPFPKGSPNVKILPPLTTKISSIRIDEDEEIEENEEIDSTEVEEENKDEDTISIWVPEEIRQKDNMNINNQSIRHFQSIWVFVLISIINIVLSN